MTQLEQAARLALEALEQLQGGCTDHDDGTVEAITVWCPEVIDALRAALEQPAQDKLVAFIDMSQWPPIRWRDGMIRSDIALFDGQPLVICGYRPQAREPLTDEQKDAARWRFLVDNSFDKEGVTQFHVWEHSWEPGSQKSKQTEWKQRVRGPALDRFIDRAIEAAHGIGEKK